MTSVAAVADLATAAPDAGGWQGESEPRGIADVVVSFAWDDPGFVRTRWTIDGRAGPLRLAVEPAILADYRERADGDRWIVDVVMSVERGFSRFGWRDDDALLLLSAYFDQRLPEDARPFALVRARLALPDGWAGELAPRDARAGSPLPIAGAALARGERVGVLDAGGHSFVVADFAPGESAAAETRARLPAIASVLAAANGRADGATRLLGFVPEGRSLAGPDAALVAGADGLAVVAHEVAHLFQDYSIEAAPDSGLWLVEGAAEYERLVALVAADAIAAEDAARALDDAWRAVPETAPALRDMDRACCRSEVYAKGATLLSAVDAALARSGDPFACVARFFATSQGARVGSADFMAWAARFDASAVAAAAVEASGRGPAPSFAPRACLVAMAGDPVGAPGFAHVRIANAGARSWTGTLALGPSADAGGTRTIAPGESVLATFPLAGEARDARVRALDLPAARPEASALASAVSAPLALAWPAVAEAAIAIAAGALALAALTSWRSRRE